jgi:fatty acid desaturase
MHEAVHGHLAKNRFVNEMFSNLFCAFPLLFDTEVYRKNHLKHHRHLNSAEDPDWVRKVGLKEWTFPASRKNLFLFIPYFVLFRGPAEWAYILWRFSGFGEKQRWKAEPGFLLFKAAYFATAFYSLIRLNIAKEAILYWFIPMFFVLTVVGRIRSVAEHFAVTYADDLNSTRDVNSSWIEGFLLAPFNVNFHLTHHVHPQIPFYRLAKAHEQFLASGEYRNAHVNGSYFFPYENSVLRDVLHGPRAKNQTPVQKIAA